MSKDEATPPAPRSVDEVLAELSATSSHLLTVADRLCEPSEATVTIPLTLFNQMAAVYYGGGGSDPTPELAPIRMGADFRKGNTG